MCVVRVISLSRFLGLCLPSTIFSLLFSVVINDPRMTMSSSSCVSRETCALISMMYSALNCVLHGLPLIFLQPQVFSVNFFQSAFSFSSTRIPPAGGVCGEMLLSLKSILFFLPEDGLGALLLLSVTGVSGVLVISSLPVDTMSLLFDCCGTRGDSGVLIIS